MTAKKIMFPDGNRIMSLPLEDLAKGNEITSEPELVAQRENYITAVHNFEKIYSKSGLDSMTLDASGDTGIIRNTETGEVIATAGHSIDVLIDMTGQDHETRLFAVYTVSNFKGGDIKKMPRHLKNEVVFYDVFARKEFCRFDYGRYSRRGDDGINMVSYLFNTYMSIGGNIFKMDTEKFLKTKKPYLTPIARTTVEGTTVLAAMSSLFYFSDDREIEGTKLMLVDPDRMTHYPILHLGKESLPPIMASIAKLENKNLFIYGVRTKEEGHEKEYMKVDLYAIDLTNPSKQYMVKKSAFETRGFFEDGKQMAVIGND